MQPAQATCLRLLAAAGAFHDANVQLSAFEACFTGPKLVLSASHQIIPAKCMGQCEIVAAAHLCYIWDICALNEPLAVKQAQDTNFAWTSLCTHVEVNWFLIAAGAFGVGC